MRRFVIALASLPLAVTAAHAVELEILNQSHTSIHHLYVSDASSRKWGPDQLGTRRGDTVEPGEKFTLTNLESGRYDLKLIAADGTECVIANQRIGQDKVWTITEAMLDGCD